MDNDGFAEAIGRLAGDELLCKKMSTFNGTKIKGYDVLVVQDELANIYKDIK